MSRNLIGGYVDGRIENLNEKLNFPNLSLEPSDMCFVFPLFVCFVLLCLF